MRFGPDYQEEVELPGGRQVRLRMVRPEDKPLFAAGMARLSPASRWRRFFSARGDLTAAELTYLTEVDGQDHVAIGAVSDGEGVAVARFIRLVPEQEVAEPAIVVIDELQGRGLGRILLSRLVEAARERGVRRFRAEVMAENAPMLALLQELSPAASQSASEPGVLLVEVPLDGAVTPGERTAIQRLLALAAEGLLCIRPRGADRAAPGDPGNAGS